MVSMLQFSDIRHPEAMGTQTLRSFSESKRKMTFDAIRSVGAHLIYAPQIETDGVTERSQYANGYRSASAGKV